MGEPARPLCADDNPLGQARLQEMSEEHGGFVHLWAGSCREFQTLSDAGEYHLVVSDFDTPGHEGLQATDTLRAGEPEWSIVVGDGLRPVGAVVGRGSGMAGRMWKPNQSLIIDDCSVWPDCRHRFQEYHLRAIMGVPIRWQETFLGALVVAADRPGVFSAEDTYLQFVTVNGACHE